MRGPLTATLAAGLETRCESQHELDHIAISVVSRVGLRVRGPRIHGDIKHPHPEQFGTGASASEVTDRGCGDAIFARGGGDFGRGREE